MENKRFVLSATEAASVLCMSQARVLELLDSGDIPAFREGRGWKIPIKGLEEWVAHKAETEAKARREVYKED